MTIYQEAVISQMLINARWYGDASAVINGHDVTVERSGSGYYAWLVDGDLVSRDYLRSRLAVAVAA